jgi:signal transduction histidine kinase
LPPLLGDPVQLEQIFVNLLRNACEAVVRPKAAVGAVLVATRLEGDSIVVTVDDNGPGIPPEKRDEIFAAFKTSKQEGLGLGLPISRTLTEAHGGSLSVETSPLGGARFIVQLPLKGGDRRAVDEAPGVVSQSGVG